MDIIEIPDAGKHYRVNVNAKGIFIEKIKADETSKKLCMIIGRKTLKKGVEQLNLHDGRNMLLAKEAKGKGGDYKVHDSIAISLPDQKITKHYRLEKGSPAFIFSGKNVGAKGTIKEVKTRKSMTEKSTVAIKSADKEIETLKDYVFVGEAGEKK
jgi:small subunit ribosomal protein S4e